LSWGKFFEVAEGKKREETVRKLSTKNGTIWQARALDFGQSEVVKSVVRMSKTS
jgi:hypothetical protein